MGRFLKFALLFGIFGGLFLMFRFTVESGKSQNMGPTGGLVEGQLKPCDIKPHCVSTMHSPNNKELYMAPVAVLKNPIAKISTTFDDMDRIKIIKEDENYIQATQTSEIFGFVDDIEFLFDPATNNLHFRSSSRVGYSDLGVNRDRVNFILQKIQ